MLDLLIYLVALAGTAVAFADVLVRDGMLLAPVQRWLREWHKRQYVEPRLRKLLPVRFSLDSEDAAIVRREIASDYYEGGFDLDRRWWWKPLWGCFVCVSGQWGFWGYLIRYHEGYTWRTIPEHLAFTAFVIIAAIILHKWTKDN